MKWTMTIGQNKLSHYVSKRDINSLPLLKILTERKGPLQSSSRMNGDGNKKMYYEGNPFLLLSFFIPFFSLLQVKKRQKKRDLDDRK